LPPAVAPVPTAAGAVPGGVDLPLKDAKERWMQVVDASYRRDLLERHSGNSRRPRKAAGIDRKTVHWLVTKYDVR
jgi:hypothetical protein